MVRATSVVSRSTVIAAALVLSGCTVGPNYKRPEMPSPATFRFAQVSQAEALSDLSWFAVFDDPVLQALVREALLNNLDVRVAVAHVQEARARAGIAKSFAYPQVDGGVSTTLRQASNATDEGDGTEDTTHASATYGFRLSWELDLFGRIRRETEAAYAIFYATDQARRGVLITLVGDVATNYFLLRELDLQLVIARRTLTLNDQTVTYFRNRLEGGVSNRLELDTAIANRSQTSAAIPDIERQIAMVENAISMLLGRPPGPVTRPLETMPELPPAIPPGIPATLLERRPDVMAAEQMLVAANADVGAAKARFYPTIGLSGFFGGVSGDLTQFLGGQGAVWSVGAGLLQPVFQGGRNKRNLEAMQARYDAAVAGYQKSALNSYREVANALITIQKLAEMRIEMQAGVVVLQDASDLSRERYDSGLASYIEILLADQQLFRQQLLLAQTRGAELRARAELYRTLGGGWVIQ